MHAAGVAAPAAIFTARAVRKIYEMGEVTVEALRGVDFDLFEGEFVVLLGPSGSGKSTLLNILGGLDVPTSGEVLYRQQNLTTAGDAALTAYRRAHVGFVFQFYNLIPSLPALENVALVTEIVERPMRPEEALELVGLGHRLEALERVNRELGTATAVITHNAAIATMADRIIRVADGRVVGIQTNTRKATARDVQW